ncbi:hypothetical protein QQS21_002489 [Conoideocrella luteorostrata]|uniref:Uncharacterized protein n=1 Tax=Conoideocrella luteorostrata TaxID=1105319 RepID=A0AAJ0FX74_9HYPO|nr:hypothetical protein QQS21_002489 [Conoideocrella luteorostrata]
MQSTEYRPPLYRHGCLSQAKSYANLVPLFFQDAPAPVSYAKVPALNNSQDLQSPAFIGRAARSEPLAPLFVSTPEASLLHGDGGNTGSQDFPGPRGVDTQVSAKAQRAFIFLWGKDNQLTSGYVNATGSATRPAYGLVALDPKSLDVLAAWYPEEKNQTLGFTYMEYIVGTNDVLVNSAEGYIWVVHRGSCRGWPYFKMVRTINLLPELQKGERLLNSMFDTEGNIWFTTGAVLAGGASLANTTTYGYITPSNKVYKAQLDGEMVENGIAIAGTNMYMNTSPTGKNNKPDAPGYMYSLTAKRGGKGSCGIETRWRVPYDAGAKTEIDPNMVTSRGSGSTPALLADKYVAMTDNDSPRVHLNVYHQEPQANGSKQQLVCQVPLFAANTGSVLNSVLGHYDSKRNKHAIMILNSYGGPPLYSGENGQDINGKLNDMSGMAGGVARVDVDQHGNCSVRWSDELHSKAVSVLSTKSGLVYQYTQDIQRAAKGEYVWYLAGRDWVTGEIIFQVRTGAGGAFNDNWTGGALGPDGTFYQSISGGVVAIKDAPQDSCKAH